MKTQDRDVKKRRRAALSKMVILLAFTVLVWLFLTIAWFTMNKENAASGMGVTVKGVDFILSVDNHPTLADITPPGANDAAAFATYYPYMTGELTSRYYDLDALNTRSVDSIRWFIQDSNPAYTDKTGLRPGSYGMLQFYVTPVDTENFSSMNMTFNLSLTAFENEYDSDGEITGISEISESSDSAEAVEYLKSHILFFEAQDANGYYSKIINGSFTKTITSENYEDPISIYWIWPNTFGQMVLFEGDTDLNDTPMFSSMQTTAENFTNWSGTATTGVPVVRMKDYIIDNYNTFFKDVSWEDSSTWDTKTESQKKTVVESKLTDITNNIVIFNTGYNNADQEIGMKIGYVMVEMTAN